MRSLAGLALVAVCTGDGLRIVLLHFRSEYPQTSAFVPALEIKAAARNTGDRSLHGRLAVARALPSEALGASEANEAERLRSAAAESQPEPWRAAAASICALVLGCVVGVSAALSADIPSNVASVDAALGFIKRNYYEQSFNRQDFDALRARTLARAQRGESAAKLTREIVASLGDRYSRVVDAATFENLMAYDPLGLGVVLARNEDKEVIVSSAPFPNSAAARAGLRQGDVVVAVDGSLFAEESLFTVMDRVAQADALQAKLALRRGPAESPSAAWEETLPRTRTAAPQSKVDYGVVQEAGGGPHRVGYLRLRNFGARSAIDLNEAISRVRADGADELVLDLRGNLGGSFQAALETAGLFLEPDTVATSVQTPAAGDRPLRTSATSAGVAREPLVLLVDSQSASASEVLAAALRGNCRAPLYGTKTYGKAAVQAVFGLPNGEAIAITVAKYSGPGGFAIADGIKPDGSGPVGPVTATAAALGLKPELSEADYAGIDFGPARQEALRSCVAGQSW